MSLKSNFDTITAVYHQWKSVVADVALLDLKHRTVLIKCCQAQFIPSHDIPPDNTLKRMILSLPPILLNYGPGYTYTETSIAYFSRFSGMMNPVEAPILLDICRSLSLPAEVVEAARQTSWKKEGIKIEGRRGPTRINWRAIFEEEYLHENLVDGVRANPAMNRSFHSALLRWRQKQTGRKLFPRATSKNMSRDTRRDFEQHSGISLHDTPMFTQIHCQQYYHTTGYKLQGSTEMRQKWYRSSAKPRTYFAQGGLHYHPACHLQDPFSDLVNSHPVCHHISRLQPSRVKLSDGAHALVYDYETFTSNMEQQTGFCRSLADFSCGVPVEILDMRVGWVDDDLGSLLHHYFDTCVYYPQVSYERCTGGLRLDEDITDHGMASMLGIFGNLMTCTFAHAAVVSSAVRTDDSINVAGDDGLAEETEENERELDICICALGTYERTKTFRTNEPGCVCLKRPLREEYGRLVPGNAIIPPTSSLIAYLLYDVADIRYSDFNDYDTPGRFSIVGKDFMRYLRSLHRISPLLSDDLLEAAIDVFQGVHRTFFGAKYRMGGLMQCGDPFFWPIYLTTADSIRTEDPMVSLVKARYNGRVTLMVEESEDPPPQDPNVGDVFNANSSKWLTWMERLGYLEREDRIQEFTGFTGYEKLLGVFIGEKNPISYQYTCNKEIPSYFVRL